MNGPQDDAPGKRCVALFPLPNVVLFPGAVLPLHIFEPRYRRMMADALEADSLIAMALLRQGWEPDYYGGRAAIEPVVCVGQIMAHERLEDGKFNLLLQGRWRALVLDESRAGGDTPYRMATVRKLPETAAMEIDLSNERQRLGKLLDEGPLGISSVGKQLGRLLAGPAPTSEIADLIAFNFVQDLHVKQALLADGNVGRRVGRILQILDKVRASLPNRPGQDPTLN